ncbi:TIM23 complex component [Malassezia cuniculi]|uniref:Presequence translocated-associated motor subunit PAM17 n=1 Tax=Malassezia cuniculi TaxID=948313 RepID=A0AAF0J7T9_9BASI|nr:TIM23 complex component [Malassezia cuniculi]
MVQALVRRMRGRAFAGVRPYSSAPEQQQRPLPWEAYLRLRNQRRIVGVLASIPTTILAGGGAGSYFMTQEIDPTQTIMGNDADQLDPMLVYVGATASAALFGWLIGPSIGNGLWSIFHRTKARQIAQRDKDFYAHIRRMRADPTRQVMHNQIPDYYRLLTIQGEKIGSISQYRRWLRDQSKFRRKAAHGLKADE